MAVGDVVALRVDLWGTGLWGSRRLRTAGARCFEVVLFGAGVIPTPIPAIEPCLWAAAPESTSSMDRIGGAGLDVRFGTGFWGLFGRPSRMFKISLRSSSRAASRDMSTRQKLTCFYDCVRG